MQTLDLLTALGDRVVWVRGNADRELVEYAAAGHEATDPDPIARPGRPRQLRRGPRRRCPRLPTTVTLAVDGLGDGAVLPRHPARRRGGRRGRLPPDRWTEVLAGPRRRRPHRGLRAHPHAVRPPRAPPLVVNPGSVGMPYGGAGAHWALLGPGSACGRRSSTWRPRASVWPASPVSRRPPSGPTTTSFPGLRRGRTRSDGAARPPPPLTAPAGARREPRPGGLWKDRAISEPHRRPGLAHVYCGKVRDIYTDGDDLILVASDGFRSTTSCYPRRSRRRGGFSPPCRCGDWSGWPKPRPQPRCCPAPTSGGVRGRAIQCRAGFRWCRWSASPGGYLAGSGLVEYADRGTVCRIPLPPGWSSGSGLPSRSSPPTTKEAVGAHEPADDVHRG